MIRFCPSSRGREGTAPTGYRKDSGGEVHGCALSERPFAHDGDVYSLEVPGAHTFVTTGGLVVHNCFPRTSPTEAAGRQLGYHFQLLTAVIEVNELQKRRVVSKLKKHLGLLVGKKVALLGLAFKPHTDDMREASSVVLASRLEGEGAIVRAYDLVAEERASQMLTGVAMCGTALEAAEGAEAVVTVTEWPEFADVDLSELKSRMANPMTADSRNMLDLCAVRAAGFVYEGIGPYLSRRPRYRNLSLCGPWILAGGEGTRLRPSTPLTVPKPVVPLANRPFISFMLDWLRRHGFDDVVMSCGFLAQGVREVLGDGTREGVTVRYVDEPKPLGTAGAVKLAQPVLAERFAVLNGDVLTDSTFFGAPQLPRAAAGDGDARPVRGRGPPRPTGSS